MYSAVGGSGVGGAEVIPGAGIVEPDLITAAVETFVADCWDTDETESLEAPSSTVEEIVAVVGAGELKYNKSYKANFF